MGKQEKEKRGGRQGKRGIDEERKKKSAKPKGKVKKRKEREIVGSAKDRTHARSIEFELKERGLKKIIIRGGGGDRK